MIGRFLDSTKKYDKVAEEVKNGSDLTDDTIERKLKEKKEMILKKKD